MAAMGFSMRRIETIITAITAEIEGVILRIANAGYAASYAMDPLLTLAITWGFDERMANRSDHLVGFEPRSTGAARHNRCCMNNGMTLT
jgi:hypothetical protein